MLRFSLLDWAVWPAVCHGQAVGSDPDALCKGQGQVDGAEVPPVKDVPLMVRRRLSLAGKLAFRVSYDLAASASDRFVFSSRYGDCNQTATIVADIAERNPVSPMAFSTSVHNAYAGMLSILTKNIKAHTAIAAGPASFCAGLTEAVCQALDAPQDDVLFVHYDVPVSDFYENQAGAEGAPFALGLRLRAQGQGTALSLYTDADGFAAAEGGAESFCDFLNRDAAHWSWSDDTTRWTCSRVAENAGQ